MLGIGCWLFDVPALTSTETPRLSGGGPASILRGLAMTGWKLIRNSLRFHWRSHLGTVLGAAIGSAVLIGALIVGDSVRETLKAKAVERLGGNEFLLTTGDRLFPSTLAERLATYIRSNRLQISVTNSGLGATAQLRSQ